MRVAAALLLLAGAGSAQMLFSLQRLSEPRAMLQLPTITVVRDPPPPPPAAADYKQQVAQRNDECYQQCAAAFPNAAGSSAACERGCRLFALGEANEPQLSADQHRAKCATDCATAYPVPVEQHSCQTGCHHQRPKQQDEDGAPVVMSVVRKYSFESEDGQQVQRSQSSVLVHDGDQMHVIEGPARVTVSQHGPMTGEMPFPSMMDGMLERMRQTMQHMLLRLNGGQPAEEAQQEQQQQEPAAVEQRLQEAEQQLRDRLSQARHDMLVTAGVQSHESSWRRAWRCTPHYVVLGVLVLGTALLLYTCYCLIVVVRRRRRREMRADGLVQLEEEAEDLPPKYSLAIPEEEVTKISEAKEAPPAYSSIAGAAAAAELPLKLDV